MDSPGDAPVDVGFSASQPDVPNAAWTWFTGRRAVVDPDAGPDGPRILVGAVTATGEDGGGDVDVLWYDVGADETGHVRLHPGFEQDDHDDPALFVRPDGRYLAMYAKHNTDPYTRWRVTTDPHDPTSWEPERTLDNGAPTTYCNVFRLPDDADGAGRTYCFTRARNWDPTVLVSTDQGSTWSHGARLVTRGGSSERPYVRYRGDGERVHVTTTENHPHHHDNGVYHGFVRDGTLYDSAGSVLIDDLLDEDGVGPAPGDLTTVFEPGTVVDGTRLTRAWTLDVASDGDGSPVALFQARAEDDPADHRFLYARHDGAEWHVSQVAEAGGQLYDAEFDYTGLATIDPGNPRRVVVSTPVDPRTGADLAHYELFAGVPDDGDAWRWTPLTPEATADNLRPLVPDWDGDRSALVWMRGQYEAYTRWETQAVGALDPAGRGE